VARGGAQANCADADGDGSAGLARLEAGFRNVRSGRRIRLILEPTEHDVDVSGLYEFAVQLGEQRGTGIGRVRVKFPRLAERR
jgi:hypothetical protein